MYLLSVLSVFVHILFSIAVLLHAMSRKRNLKNQLNWGAERVGLRRTVMAVLLEELSFRLDIEV